MVAYIAENNYFFKQKTAYVISVCDWSSDVCSSDLLAQAGASGVKAARVVAERLNEQ